MVEVAVLAAVSITKLLMIVVMAAAGMSKPKTTLKQS